MSTALNIHTMNWTRDFGRDLATETSRDDRPAEIRELESHLQSLVGLSYVDFRRANKNRPDYGAALTAEIDRIENLRTLS